MGGGNGAADEVSESNGGGDEVTVNIRCSNGSKFSVGISLSSTVEAFKAVLAGKCDVPADQQRLIYKGRILKDDQTLHSYGLEADHTVHLVRGFAPTAAANAAPASNTGAPNAASANAQAVGSNEGGALGGSGFGASLFPGLGLNGLGGSGGMFGAGLPEFEQVQQQLTRNPNIMREIMNMPVIQNLMNNPEIMRNLIMNNPQMREIIDRNPELAHILNDPSTLRQTLEAARNPELMREMMRNTDRAMSNIESSPEGFNMLRRMYETVQEPFLNATTMAGNTGGDNANPFAALLGNQAAAGSTNPSTTSSQSTTGSPAPNTNPLPNPWTAAFSQFSALAASSIKKVQNHQKIKPLSTTSTTQPQPSMASSTQPAPNRHHSNLFHSATTALISLVSSPKASPLSTIPLCPPKICIPFQFADSSYPLIQSIRSPFDSNQPESVSPKSAAVKGLSSAESNSGFPSTVRIAGLKSNGKSGGPAFVGQVFSMCDLSGTGLMAVSTHFDIPFISKRTPEWLKKIFATVTKSERNGPVFRFFIDLGDAVAYVKRLNIPSGVVGACRLDLAYEHFKEKPHLFQFVPNEKQVKAANQLLKKIPQGNGRRKVDGVPVFTAQNLDIAIATADGIKWYTPYFFDKNMLDNILEESVDQHFHSLIQTRHMQRRRDVVDDNLAAEVIEEMGDNMLEPPEVQEMLDEMGHPGIPLSVISKAAEIQLLHAVDRVLLGNRWLRKATGIQPKFPYMVDSFEKRSASSFQRASESTSYLANPKTDSTSNCTFKDNAQADHEQKTDLRIPFGDWFRHPWLKQKWKPEKLPEIRSHESLSECTKQKLERNSFLPKITMVGISTGEAGQMSKASLKKTMEDLTRELEQTDRENATGSSSNSNELEIEYRDPLFVANVGDYYSGMSRTNSSRWVRGGSR